MWVCSFFFLLLVSSVIHTFWFSGCCLTPTSISNCLALGVEVDWVIYQGECAEQSRLREIRGERSDLLPSVSWLKEAKWASRLREVRWKRLAYIKSDGGRSVTRASDSRTPLSCILFILPHSFCATLYLLQPHFLPMSMPCLCKAPIPVAACLRSD